MDRAEWGNAGLCSIWYRLDSLTVAGRSKLLDSNVSCLSCFIHSNRDWTSLHCGLGTLKAKSKATHACNCQDATSAAFCWSVQVTGQPDSRREEIGSMLDGEEQRVRTGMGGFKQGKCAGHVVDK